MKYYKIQRRSELIQIYKVSDDGMKYWYSNAFNKNVSCYWSGPVDIDDTDACDKDLSIPERLTKYGYPPIELTEKEAFLEIL